MEGRRRARRARDASSPRRGPATTSTRCRPGACRGARRASAIEYMEVPGARHLVDRHPRARRRRAGPIRYLLPESVVAYIEKNGLYREGGVTVRADATSEARDALPARLSRAGARALRARGRRPPRPCRASTASTSRPRASRGCCTTGTARTARGPAAPPPRATGIDGRRGRPAQSRTCCTREAGGRGSREAFPELPTRSCTRRSRATRSARWT